MGVGVPPEDGPWDAEAEACRELTFEPGVPFGAEFPSVAGIPFDGEL